MTPRQELEQAVTRALSDVTEPSAVPPSFRSADVSARIMDAFRRIAESDAASVSVVVRDGCARLRGSVHSLEERHAAEQAAYATPGVFEVENDLEVRFHPRV